MAVTDLFRKYKSLHSTTLSASISTGTGETITLGSVTNLPTDTEITITIDRVDSSGNETSSKMERITGTLVGSGLTSYTRAIDNTTDQAHSSGAVVEMVWNAKDLNDIVDGLLVEHGQTGFHNNLPRGFLSNGKIVPSVASDDLTVAIKGMDGNDPSATNPVYIRIGDTVRVITAALSVTKAAGTNWCNSGSDELAAKEIDYFVYLGYNATDGVVIGFSRIPFAREYSEFSATTTNEKYCAISDISNAAAGDDYENIGRFAATLAAGAGYEWTVPAFSNINLIQRPIYETRDLIWTPTFDALAPMTYTSVTAGVARYKLMGSIMFVNLYSSGTTGGTASAQINATIPFDTLASTNGACGIADGNFAVGFYSILSGDNVLKAGHYDYSDWVLAAGKRIKVNIGIQI